MKLFSNIILSPRCYEGDPPPTGAPPPPTGAPPPPTGTPPKTFVQEDVNAIVNREKQKWNKEREALTAKIAAAAGNVDAIAALNEELEAIKTSSMTDAEKRQRERDKADKKSAKEIEDLKASGEAWQKRYKDQLIATQIGNAASEAGAFNNRQMQRLLSLDTEVVEKEGTYSVVVHYDTVDEAKKPIRIPLSPKEVMERMKENPNTMNLFNSTIKGGIGGSGGSAPGSGPINSQMTADQVRAKYLEARKSGNQMSPFAKSAKT